MGSGVVLVGLALRAPAIAEISATQIVTHGLMDIPACATCHGVNGAGLAVDGVPRIGGMNEHYLVHELKSMASGDRESAVMSPIARKLSLSQMKEVASYFAQKSPSMASTVLNLRRISYGERLALDGAWSRGIPACTLCHGRGGVGIGSKFPSLAGQYATYLDSQLRAWRSGSRHNDPMHLMEEIAKKLDERDILGASAYFSALPDIPRIAQTSQSKRKVGFVKSDGHFVPPSRSAMPSGPFGDMVKLGQHIFVHTRKYAPRFTGNSLSCSDCHLDAGRLANSAPLWAAYVAYPAYRKNNGRVNSFEQRIQGCFRFSMNGHVPPLGSSVFLALQSYAYFLAKGAPTGVSLKGRGYPRIAKPALPMSYRRGRSVYRTHCALCHGVDGQGRLTEVGEQGFPPLWGGRSFNLGGRHGGYKDSRRLYSGQHTVEPRREFNCTASLGCG